MSEQTWRLLHLQTIMKQEPCSIGVETRCKRVQPQFWEPESVEELEAIVKHCHENKKPVRPLGAGLSRMASDFILEAW